MDLYLNGNYAELYLLSERNEVESQRVDIGETDSFLLSMEFEDRWNGTNYPAFLSMHGNLLRIHHAGMPADWAREVWQSAEDAIYADDGIDPVTGKHWRELIDVDSWAEQYLLREVFADGDACAMSQFFYYTQSVGRLYAGPLWDMDNTLNCWKTQIPNVLTAARL